MKNLMTAVRRTIITMVMITLICGGNLLGEVNAESATPAAKTATDNATVYYISNGDLYRVKTDGSVSEKIQDNFDGYKVKQAGNYLYYFYDENSTTLLRKSLADTSLIPSKFGGDKEILYFETVGNYIYFMDEDGRIYRASGDAASYTEATMITDMADTDFPNFSIVNGKVYYNALKNGRTTWVASKAVDGSGNVQWVASGAVESSYFVQTYNSNLYMMVNTKPEETQYSTNCIVLYQLPIKGGTAKAINAKAPLDVNAVYSGSWVNDSYMFNKDIRLGSDREYDYTLGKGHIITKTGKTYQLNKTGIYEIVSFGANKFAYVDSKGKAYVSTVANNKVTSTKAIARTNVGYIRNLMNGSKVKSTVLFASSGTYVLNSDLSTKKLTGVEWDYSTYEDGVSGIFYSNAADNFRLYRMSDDGKTSTKLTDEEITRVVLITKP